MNSRLALGTAQFGLPYGIANQSGQVSREGASAILAFGRSSGIDTLDTAIAYGDSEVCLGAIGTEDFKLTTKLPAVPETCRDIGHWVQDQMNLSLRRLGLTRIYGLLLHTSQQLIGPDGKAMGQALQSLKAAGIVQKIGVSIYSPVELDLVTRAWRIDLVQAPFNLIDRRLHTSGWLQKLHDGGIEVHARSIFLQGLLLMPRTSIPMKFHRWAYIWDAWHAWLAAHPVSAAQACIGFAQAYPQIDRLVVGVENVKQLYQLVAAAREPLNVDLPDIGSTDENLINPSFWNAL